MPQKWESCMTHVTFESCGRPLTTENIVAFEKQLGCRLPDDYREFMLTHNGGTPHPNSFDRQMGGEILDSWIDCFYSIDDNLATPRPKAGGQTISFNRYEYGDDVPNDCLMIGSVARDNQLLLRLHGERRGQIDHKIIVDFVEQEDQGPESCVYYVAESFSALLAMLRPCR